MDRTKRLMRGMEKTQPKLNPIADNMILPNLSGTKRDPLINQELATKNYVDSQPHLELGETSTTAYRGDRGKTAYDHSQIAGGNSVHVSTTENTNWDTAYTHSQATSGNPHSVEGTEIKSTGEGGGTKYLREDGDGTCSWQTPAGGGSVEGTEIKSTGEGGGTKYLREDGDGTCSWQTPAGGGSAKSFFMACIWGGINITAGATAYMPVFGANGSNNNENYSEQIIVESLTSSNLTCEIIVNTLNGNTVIKSRINSADGNQSVTFAATATGTATDAVNNDSLSQYDQVSTKIDSTAAGSGSGLYLRTSYKVV